MLRRLFFSFGDDAPLWNFVRCLASFFVKVWFGSCESFCGSDSGNTVGNCAFDDTSMEFGTYSECVMKKIFGYRAIAS